MKRNRFFLWLALLPALVVFGTGCSGINASQSISPLSFFLPGLVQTKKPEETKPVVSHSPSDSTQTVAQSL